MATRSAGLGIAALAVVALVAACGGDSSSSPPSVVPASVTDPATTTEPPEALPTTTAIPTTTTEAATTTTLSQVELGKIQYYIVVSQRNTGMFDLWARLADSDDTISWKNYPALCLEAAPIEEKMARDLNAYKNWPEDVQDEIDALVAATATQAGLYYECSKLPGTASALSDVDSRITAAVEVSGAAASAARLALGLPIDR